MEGLHTGLLAIGLMSGRPKIYDAARSAISAAAGLLGDNVKNIDKFSLRVT